MAHGRRVERVASLIRREVSDLLINGIRDDRIAHQMITITNVSVSGDLQHCKIYVSIFGPEISKQDVLDGLESSSVFVRGEIARRLQMRRAPEIIFVLDRGLEKGTDILGLLGKLEKQRKNKQGPNEISNKQ
tara:strand:- start:9 stop:404 length:396 start_codon:yes stop_codon:yes gene_type:complete